MPANLQLILACIQTKREFENVPSVCTDSKPRPGDKECKKRLLVFWSTVMLGTGCKASRWHLVAEPTQTKGIALFPRTFWEVIGAVETKCVVILLRCIRVICVLTKKACACVASERIERLLLKHLSLPQTTLVSNAEQG